MGAKNFWGKPTSPEKTKCTMAQVWAILAVVQLETPASFSTVNGSLSSHALLAYSHPALLGSPSSPRALCWPVPCTVSYLWLQSWMLQLKPLSREE